MYLNTYVSIEIFIELFYYISSQVTCFPLACNPHHTLFVPRHFVSGTSAHAVCFASAWCNRDWVNGDVYFWNTISPKVTLMLLDILRTVYVKWVIFMWEPDQDT